MPTLFISCVSDEFANYRDAIRRDLTRPNLDTKIQEDFIAYGGATLEKLDDYIQHCEAVIHICGDMTGSMANKLSIQYINNKYKDFATRFPTLQEVLNGTAQLSYTQWEAYLAVYHGKRLFIVAPTANALRDNRYIKDPEQVMHQQEHLNRLKQLGYYDEIHFNNEDNLVKNLYRSKLGDILNAIPKVKPVAPQKKVVSNKLSIIIPMYNEQERIGETLIRLLTKKLDKRFPILIYDDGSKDKSFKTAKIIRGKN